MKQMRWILLVMMFGLGIAFYWDKVPALSSAVHSVLDPTLGKLILYNHYLGMIIIAAALNFIVTILQKYTIDKETMKEIKKEQKDLKDDMKKYKDHPEKLMEINKRQMELLGKSLPLTMRPVIFTSIPFILLFRWFHELFGVGGILEGIKFLGYLNWFVFYIVVSILFSTLFRKWLDVI